MKHSYFTFHLLLTVCPQVNEDKLSEVGSAAWRLLHKKLEAWPLRQAEVQEGELTLVVPVLEICEDDVRVSCVPGSPDLLTYGLAVYSEQVSLALTPMHLAEVVSMSVAAMQEAACAAGVTSAAVVTRVEVQERGETNVHRSAPDCTSLLELDDEVNWVASDPMGGLTGLYHDRDAAFAAGAGYVEAFNASGKPVRSYARTSAPEAGVSKEYTFYDYAVEA